GEAYQKIAERISVIDHRAAQPAALVFRAGLEAVDMLGTGVRIRDVDADGAYGESREIVDVGRAEPAHAVDDQIELLGGMKHEVERAGDVALAAVDGDHSDRAGFRSVRAERAVADAGGRREPLAEVEPVLQVNAEGLIFRAVGVSAAHRRGHVGGEIEVVRFGVDALAGRIDSIEDLMRSDEPAELQVEPEEPVDLAGEVRGSGRGLAETRSIDVLA